MSASRDGFALCPPTLVEIVELGKGVFRGSERSQAGAVAVEVIGDRKDRQHRIADELQDLAAVAMDRRYHAGEVVVQKRDDLVARQRLGRRREAAQVAVPERGRQGYAIAPLNEAAEDAAPGVMTQIGIEQSRGETLRLLHFEDEGEQWGQVLEPRDLGTRKAAGPVGRDADGVHAPCTEPQRNDQIVGDGPRPPNRQGSEIRRGGGSASRRRARRAPSWISLIGLRR